MEGIGEREVEEGFQKKKEKGDHDHAGMLALSYVILEVRVRVLSLSVHFQSSVGSISTLTYFYPSSSRRMPIPKPIYSSSLSSVYRNS